MKSSVGFQFRDYGLSIFTSNLLSFITKTVFVDTEEEEKTEQRTIKMFLISVNEWPPSCTQQKADAIRFKRRYICEDNFFSRK